MRLLKILHSLCFGILLLNSSQALGGLLIEEKEFAVAVVQDAKGKILIEPLPARLKDQPRFLIGMDGNLHALSSEQWLDTPFPESCGVKINPGQIRLAKGNVVKSFLVAIGKDVDKKLKWVMPESSPNSTIEAKQKPDKDGCEAGYKTDYEKTEDDKVWIMKDPAFRLKQSHWKAPKDHFATCPKDATAAVLTATTSAGACRTLNWSLLDCDDQGPGIFKFKDFLGVLVYEYASPWLIFESKGYEAQGFTAMEVNDFLTFNIRKTLSSHPWGC